MAFVAAVGPGMDSVLQSQVRPGEEAEEKHAVMKLVRMVAVEVQADSAGRLYTLAGRGRPIDRDRGIQNRDCFLARQNLRGSTWQRFATHGIIYRSSETSTFGPSAVVVVHPFTTSLTTLIRHQKHVAPLTTSVVAEASGLPCRQPCSHLL